MNPPDAEGRLSRRQAINDLLFAVLVGTVVFLVTAAFSDEWSAADETIDGWALTLVVVAFGSLAFRRRWPLVTLALTTLATSLYLNLSYPYGLIFLAFAFAVYSVARRLPMRTAAWGVGAAMVLMLTHVFTHPDAIDGLLGLVPGSAWAVIPFAIGTTVRVSREAREAARAEAVRQQIYEERMRIAQEVHDIVGHGLAAIQMQADIALHVDEQQSTRTRSALESISRASSEAFDELRTTLEVINGPVDASRAPPAPGLEDIEDLCDRIRSAGVAVKLAITGNPHSLAPGVELAIYRVVQESLTNVIRHGSVSEANVAFHYEDDHIDLEVTNPGPALVQSVSGRGIDGMRRRVEAVGGQFDAGPTANGFEVTARLPMGEGQ